jgi:hypothetical protein
MKVKKREHSLPNLGDTVSNAQGASIVLAAGSVVPLHANVGRILIEGCRGGFLGEVYSLFA